MIEELLIQAYSYYKASKTEILDLCQRKLVLAMRQVGRHFILNLRIYCSFHHNEAGIFKSFVLFGNWEKDEAGINYNF